MPKAPLPLSPILSEFQAAFEARIASLTLAEKWDNVGMLVESVRSMKYEKLRVLTCIDLTKQVSEEAVRENCNFIVAYHPILFRATKNLTLSSQSAVLTCLDAGISVFSPHTALDAAEKGMNDFLCDLINDPKNESSRCAVSVDPVTRINSGRIVYFKEPVPLSQFFATIKKSLNIPQLRVACNIEHTAKLNSFAVCVGSGSSVLQGCVADVYITGEMSHHEILAATSIGKVVVLLDHSSSERPFLPELARRLREFEMIESVLLSRTDREPISTV